MVRTRKEGEEEGGDDADGWNKKDSKKGCIGTWKK